MVKKVQAVWPERLHRQVELRMASGRLNLHERYRIHALHEACFSIRAITALLERAPSTISRELRRNRTGRCYRPEAAHPLMGLRQARASRRAALATWSWTPCTPPAAKR